MLRALIPFLEVETPGTPLIELSINPQLWLKQGPKMGVLAQVVIPLLEASSEPFLILHGSTISDKNGAICILGPSGAGKTTTTLACLSQGATLISDDISTLTMDPPMAHPFSQYLLSIHPQATILLREYWRTLGLSLSEMPHGLQLEKETDKIVSFKPLPGIKECHPVPLKKVVLLDDTGTDFQMLVRQSLPLKLKRQDFHHLAELISLAPFITQHPPVRLDDENTLQTLVDFGQKFLS